MISLKCSALHNQDNFIGYFQFQFHENQFVRHQGMFLFRSKHFCSTVEAVDSKIVFFMNEELWFSQTMYLNIVSILQRHILGWYHILDLFF